MRTRRRSASRVTSCIALLIFVVIHEIHGEYLMGGHLDNKEDQSRSTVISRRIDDEIVEPATVISSRTATKFENLDSAFDLELDRLADQSSADPTRASSSVSFGEDADILDEEESGISPRYRVPLAPYAFNGGQPFSLEKDPITGQIDFEKAPPLKALDYNAKTIEEGYLADSPSSKDAASASDAGSSVDSKPQRDESLGPNEINPYSPSFHDFLNLPSRYSYDKYEKAEKYPLISSSYANTKVQSGGNSYNTYNHKKYHEAVKGGVDVASLYVQPMRKTYQPVTRSTTTRRTTEKQSTTPEPTTTTEVPTTTSITTTTTRPTIRTTTKRFPSRYAPVTTWKPQRPSLPAKHPGEPTDYEGTLPIERLQTTSTAKQRTSTEPSSHLVQEGTKPSTSVNDEYDDGYEDYDRLFQSVLKPSSETNQNNESDNDYSYGGLDLIGEKNSQYTTEKIVSSTRFTKEKNSIAFSDTPTTYRPSSSSTSDDRRTSLDEKDDLPTSTTTVRPSVTEEKRITSMPLDTIVENYRPSYGSNGHQGGGIDNSIPSVTSNVVYQQFRPPANDQFYARPSLPLPAPGIVVKSTSNVVVPPGQDTVSFVLGNRQSVGTVSDAGSDYYSVHTGSMNDRTPIAFGKIGNSRPMIPDNYPGEMIVSADIGVGQNTVGQSYNQRPSTNSGPFDHAFVSVGMPTVEVANTGNSEVNTNPNKNTDSATNSLDTLAQKWWTSTSDAGPKNQQTDPGVPNPQKQHIGYRVVFPDDASKTSKNGNSYENPGVTPRPIEEHVIVIHESDIRPGTNLDLEIPSQSVSTSNPTTSFIFETSTLRSTGGKDEQQGLPELSESLTPPAARPNRVPITSHRPPSYYNYYHHQSPGSGNSRPNDHRDQRPQRVPLQPPPPPPQSSSSPSGFKRRPPSTTLESNLPNILPQFRPNAKTSHGHNRGETIGTVPAGAIGHYPSTWFRRQTPPQPHHHHHHHHQHQHQSSPSRPRPSDPSHLQRLNPPPLPPLPPPINSLRLPTPAALVAPPELGISNQDSQAQNSDEVARLALQKRHHKVVVGVPPSLAIDERHHQSSGGQIKSRLEDDNLEKFSAEPPNQPPRAPFYSKRTAGAGPASDPLPEGMPRVATLQMIQQHGGRDDDAIRTNLPPPYRYNPDNSKRHDDREKDADVASENSGRPGVNRRGDEASTFDKSEIQGDEGTRNDYGTAADSPVYVVYPVKGALDIRPPTHGEESDPDDNGSVVLGTYGSQRPLPPDTLLKNANDNDSTNGEQNYRPSSVNVSPPFTDPSSPQLASDFPYALERPDPSMFTSQLSEKPLLVPNHHSKNNQRPDLQGDDDGEEEDDKSGVRREENNDKVNNQHDFERDASVNVIPYPQDHLPFALRDHNAVGPISATLHRLGGSSIVTASSTPLAYVYTPTMRTPIRRPDEVYHHANFERPVLLPSQQASSSSSSAPAPQSFMAPFVASASAEAPTKNGWSVVMVGSPAADGSSMDRRRGDTDIRSDSDKESSQDDKNREDEDKKNSEDIDAEEKKNVRGDETKSTEADRKMDEQEMQTEKSEFDVENFTPQLFGGFKPIFEFPSDTDTVGDKVSGDAMVERPRSSSGNDEIARPIRVSDV